MLMANVLIVDDDFDIAESLADLLQRAGHFVRMAATGEEGLRALRAAHLPDCVLLDVDMPVLSGPEMVHRMLLHDAGEEDVPVVLLSGRPDLPAIAKKIGTPYLLSKPADSQVLLDLLDRALRERTPPIPGEAKEEIAGEAASRATVSPERDVTDQNLREERDRVDTLRVQHRATREHDADDVVQLARHRADAVLRTARAEQAQVRKDHPVSEQAQAASQREGREADLAMKSDRLEEDQELRKERGESQHLLDEFLQAERALTDVSLEDERLHSDVVVASRDEFLNMVTHDLRSLIGGVDMNASLLMRHAPKGEPGANARKWAERIREVIRRMNRLVGDLLDITSIEAGHLRVVPEPVDARDVSVDTVAAFAELARARKISLVFEDDGAGGRPVVGHFDRGRVEQVLANLLSNALKFTQEGGRIVVRLARLEGAIRFSVKDDGPGIAPELLTAIFERYRQIRADRRGLGLGLYISKCIVEAHGGAIWVESQPGHGSTFYFTIPT